MSQEWMDSAEAIMFIVSAKRVDLPDACDLLRQWLHDGSVKATGPEGRPISKGRWGTLIPRYDDASIEPKNRCAAVDGWYRLNRFDVRSADIKKTCRRGSIRPVDQAKEAIGEIWPGGIPSNLSVKELNNQINKRLTEKLGRNVKLDDNTLRKARRNYAS